MGTECNSGMSAQVDVLDWINHIPCRCMSIAELGERDTGCKRCQARAAVAALIAERDALREALGGVMDRLVDRRESDEAAVIARRVLATAGESA